MTDAVQSRTRRLVTIQQLETIVNAPADMRVATLAKELGLCVDTVYAYRNQIQRLGGVAQPLHWKTCVLCGEPLAARRRSQLVHRTCQREHSLRMQRGYYYQKVTNEGPVFARQPVERQNDMLDRLHGADKRDQELTIAMASRGSARWTETEDLYLLEHIALPARALAIQLRRSLYSVRRRKQIVRKQFGMEERD